MQFDEKSYVDGLDKLFADTGMVEDERRQNSSGHCKEAAVALMRSVMEKK